MFFKIRWLATHPGNAVNLAQISEYMADTYSYRAEKIQKAKDATEALMANPRYIDTDFGRLVSIIIHVIYIFILCC